MTLCDRRIDGVRLDAIDAMTRPRDARSRDAIDAMSRLEGPSQYKDAASHGAENSGSFCTVKPHNVRFCAS